VSKIFQGILKAKNLVFTTSASMVKLWLHECCRVFYDRLVNDEDREWFVEESFKTLQIYFKVDWKKEDLFEGKTPLIFADFLKKGIDV